MYSKAPSCLAKNSPPRLAELDALRGIAAISVVLFHFTINAHKTELGWAFSYGAAGVDLFFMISGFVIFLSITKIKRWQDFLANRIARLYPAFWFCLTITTFFILIFETRDITLSDILANATMVPNYFGIEDLDGSYWTLAIELIFYLWIFLLYILKKLDRIESIGLFTIASIIIFHQFNLLYPDFYLAVTRKVQLLNHFSLFYSGILFYRLKINKKSWKTMILILLSLFASCYLRDRGGRAQFHISALDHYILLTSFHLIFMFFISGGLTILKLRPLLFLGKVSYCLYLVHQVVGLVLIARFTSDLRFNIHTALVLTIAICIGMAYFINRFIEVPCNKRIRNFLQIAFR